MRVLLISLLLSIPSVVSAGLPFGAGSEACDFVTKHGVCVAQTVAPGDKYSRHDFEVVEAVVLAMADAPSNILQGLVVIVMDNLGDPNLLGQYVPAYGVIKVLRYHECIGVSSLAHEFMHAIEYRTKKPGMGVSLGHSDPFYWGGYHKNAITQPWGATARSERVIRELICEQ